VETHRPLGFAAAKLSLCAGAAQIVPSRRFKRQRERGQKTRAHLPLDADTCLASSAEQTLAASRLALDKRGDPLTKIEVQR